MSRRRWTSLAAGVAAGLALSGCQSLKKPAPPPPMLNIPPPAVQPALEPAPAAPAPVRTAPPVVKMITCVPKSMPRAPKYPDTAEALRDAGGAADRYQLMAAGRILREKRLAELERAIDACRQGG